MPMKAKAIKITTDNKLLIIDVPRKASSLLETLKKEIGGWVELVSPRTFHTIEYLQEKVMVVDEDGICKGKKPNRIATDLYGNYSTIAGDVLILKYITTEDGMDVGGLTENEADQLYAYLAVRYDLIKKLNGGNKNE